MSMIHTLIANQSLSTNYTKLAFSVKLSPSGAVTPIKDVTLWVELFNLERARLALRNTLAQCYTRRDVGALAQIDGVAVLLKFGPSIERVIGSAAHVAPVWDLSLVPNTTGGTYRWPTTKTEIPDVLGTLTRAPGKYLWTWDPDPEWQHGLRTNFPAIFRGSARP
jgi:hypothetical protein